MKLKLENSPEENNTEEIQNNSENSSKPKNNNLRRRLILIMGIVLGGIIVLLVVLFLISLFSQKKYSYQDVEDIMKNAAIEYYKDHEKQLLEKESTNKKSINASSLSKNEYMKSLDEYLGENSQCKGRVEVSYQHGSYVYIPYLTCEDKYTTKTLTEEITSTKNIVTSGYGLYQMNNEYVYRGENVKNYIILGSDDESLWRIVKITNTGEIVLIKDLSLSQPWDDRYNIQSGYNSGINDYALSRIKDEIKILYSSDDENQKMLTKEERKHLVAFDQCSGKRATNYTANDNSQECSMKESSQMIGLLTLSDYLNASTDPNCNSPLARACQNYNYLKNQYDWWLGTALSENTYHAYYVTRGGYVKQAYTSNFYYIRPVVHLNQNTIYDKGDGSLKNPYRIR